MLIERNTRALLFAALAVISLAAGVLRWQASHLDGSNPDEGIAKSVVVKVLSSGTLDTNWNRTDVSSRFKSDQYNFSSYYLTGALYEVLSGRQSIDTPRHQAGLVGHLRELSAMLGALCVFFAGLLGWRMGGTVTALVAALLTACSPGLFQASLYARPETFVTLFSLLWMIVLTSSSRHGILTLALAGLLGGILIATKVTFLVYLPFPLLLASRYLEPADAGLGPEEAHHRRWSAALAVYFCAVAAGFALGAPYALKFPYEYLRGVASLLDQYQSSVLVRGPGSAAAMLRLVGYNCAYLAYTIGYPALLLAACGAVALRKNLWHALILAAPLLLLLYFMRVMPLFERNFAQSLPSLFLLAGLGARAIVDCIRGAARLRALVAAMLIAAAVLMPAIVTAKIIHPSLDGAFQAEVQAESKRVSQDGKVAVFDSEYVGPFCGSYLYMLPRPGHQRVIDSMLLQGFHVVDEVESPFSDGVSYTLEDFYAPSTVFLAPPADGGRCELSLMPLTYRTGLVPVTAHVATGGGWNTDTSKSKMSSSAEPWSLYYSDDKDGRGHNTGSLTIGPFRTCDAVTVPYTMGPTSTDISIKITRRNGKDDVPLFDGILPGARYQWQALEIRPQEGTCATYTVEAIDQGTGWGQWLGIGMPMHQPDAAVRR